VREGKKGKERKGEKTFFVVKREWVLGAAGKKEKKKRGSSHS